MTEKQVDTLISLLYILPFMLLVFGFAYLGSDRSSKAITTNSSKQRSVWDKIKIVAMLVAALAALLSAYVAYLNISKS